MRRRLRTTRLGALIAAGIALIAGGSVGAWAALRATATNAGNSATSGTVELTDNDQGQALFNLSNLKPGDTATQCMRVSYTGTLPARVRLYGSDSGTGLEDDVAVRITRGTMASDPGPRSCTGFTADSTTWVTGGNPGEIYVGALKDFPGSYAAGLGDPTTASPATWSNGTIRAYRIQLAVGDNRSYEGKNVTQSFTWEARDTSGYTGSVFGTSGLMSFWRLGESSGTSAADSRGSNNGTYSAATLGQAGAIAGDSDTAAGFDGAAGYVSVARQISDDFSLEFWFKSTQGISTALSWYSGAGLVDAEVAGVTTDFGTSLNSQGRVLAGVGSPDTFVNSGTGYNDGAWHHVVFTRVRSTGAIKLYVDGSGGTGSMAATGGTAALTAPPNVTFGRLRTAINYLAGTLDEVAIYNRALTATEVQTHYDAGRGN